VSSSPGRAWPIHPLLFAAYAVLFLFAGNVAEVGLRDVVPPLGRSIIGAALGLAICGLLYRDLRRGALVASALVAAFFGYGHLAGILGANVPREVQLLAWAVLVVGTAILAWRLSTARIGSLTLGLDVIAGALVVINLVQVVPPTLDRIAQANAPLPDRPAPNPADPDIWFLVFDRYGSSEAMALAADGFQNDLPAFLEERGFQVADEARANYGRTAMSLASTFSMELLDELVAREGAGSTDAAPLTEMLQDHAVGRYLRERGYRIHQLGSWFTPTATSRIADVVHQPGLETDFEVLLRGTTMLPLLDELVERPEIDHADEQHREFAMFQFRELERVRSEPGPKLVFAHILLPHPPYVFLEDGSYPTKEQRAAPAPERFAAQIRYTNDRIREVVDQILDAPDGREPVVIVAADEGPYPPGYGGDQGTYDWETAPPEALLTKYGILQAIHLPGAEPGAIPEDLSPVNTFRLLFSRLFGEDLPLLPDRSFTSRDWTHPYDVTDITERLAAAGAAPGPDAAPSPAASPTPGA
jgi:hypothetical protein